MSLLLLESFVYKFSNYRFLFSLLGLNVSSLEHSENNNIIKLFSNPKILITSNVLLKCYIVQKKSSNQYYILKIDSGVLFQKINKLTLVSMIEKDLRINRTMQEPYVRKLMLINSIDKNTIDGDFFSMDNQYFYMGNEINSNGVKSTTFFKLFWKKFFASLNSN